MKPSTFLLGAGLALTILFMVHLLGEVQTLKVEARRIQTPLAGPVTPQPATPQPTPATHVAKAVPAHVQSPTDIADYMTKLQRHVNKLYFAGKLENWPLADFYVEEIEETVNEIVRKELTDGPVDISGLIPALMNDEILELERAVAQKNLPEFGKHYQTLISNCNACHTATKRPYLVIDLPRTPIFDNQNYAPVVTDVPVETSLGAGIKLPEKSLPASGPTPLN